jgi:SAM-dependent methyltransferase
VPHHIRSIKEVVRHVLYRTGGTQALLWVKRARGHPTCHLAEGTIEDRFATIHRDRVWSVDGSVSGPGSDERATAAVQIELARLLHDLRATRVTDIGCGDFGWMHGVSGDFHYCGVDIVAELIAELTPRYGDATRQFIHLDATRDDLPEGDVALCREVLFHLSFADGLALLRNLRARNYRYLIATSDTATWFNADIPSGDYRPMSLAARPFWFPEPLRAIRDDRVVPGRILGAWRLSDLDSSRSSKASAASPGFVGEVEGAVGSSKSPKSLPLASRSVSTEQQ